MIRATNLGKQSSLFVAERGASCTTQDIPAPRMRLSIFKSETNNAELTCQMFKHRSNNSFKTKKCWEVMDQIHQLSNLLPRRTETSHAGLKAKKQITLLQMPKIKISDPGFQVARTSICTYMHPFPSASGEKPVESVDRQGKTWTHSYVLHIHAYL